MAWMIRAFVGIVITTVTGSVSFIVWYLIGRFLERFGYLGIMYRFLQLIPLTYICPVIFLGLDLWDRTASATEGMLFVATPILLHVSKICLLVWGLGIICATLFFLRQWIQMQYILKLSIPLPQDIQQMAEQLRKDLGCKHCVHVRQSYNIKRPVLYGLFRPVVLTPVQTYSEKEWKVILTHEFTHIKHNDYGVRLLTIITLIGHWFNLFTWWLYISFTRWCEYACDDRTIRVLGSQKEYFLIIAHMADPQLHISNQISVPLWEDRHQLLCRIRRVKQMNKKHIMPKTIVAIFCVVMLGFDAIGVYAAEKQVIAIYNRIYDATCIEEEEENIPPVDDYVEFVEGPDELFMEEEVDESAQITANGTVHFDWTVPNNTTKKTSSFSISSNQSIKIALDIDPSNKTVKAGIILPSGNKKYVTGSGSIAHTFTGLSAGTYQVFVKNTSGRSVDVVGYAKVN